MRAACESQLASWFSNMSLPVVVMGLEGTAANCTHRNRQPQAQPLPNPRLITMAPTLPPMGYRVGGPRRTPSWHPRTLERWTP